MNSPYVSPRARAAALRRMTQRLRNVRFLAFRSRVRYAIARMTVSLTFRICRRRPARNPLACLSSRLRRRCAGTAHLPLAMCQRPPWLRGRMLVVRQQLANAARTHRRKDEIPALLALRIRRPARQQVPPAAPAADQLAAARHLESLLQRSEESRVGKECRSR